MKLAIVGPRDLELPVDVVARAMKEVHWSGVDLSGVTEVVTGCARGVDHSAVEFAKHQGLPYTMFGAGWGRLKEGAGPERNKRLVGYLDPGTDVMVALVDRFGTRGTESVTHIASEADVFVEFYKNESWKQYRRKK